jgi:uncharacterized repeat protein (TIGR01451 family)
MPKFARVSLVTALICLLAVPAGAQETVPTELSLMTPYVGVSVKPGDSATFKLDVAAPPDSRVALELQDLPEGWEGRLQGGGFVLDEVLVDSTGHVSVDLDLDVPADATDGSYNLSVEARSGGSVEVLPLSLTVATDVGGQVTLSTDYPSLKGPSDSTYSYTLQLSNGTPQEIQFGLSVEGPTGWQTDIRPSGEAKAATVTVAGGDSATVTVEVTPDPQADAGQYSILAHADGGGQNAEVELGVEISGTYEIELSSASEVLNLDVHAGQPATFDLVVANTGSATLQGITFSATPPSGWDVTFQPSGVDSLEAGATLPVTATITPSDQAINGDYALSLSASVPEAQATAQVRATVQTSAVWGLVGIAVIALALIGLTMVFRRYGRR